MWWLLIVECWFVDPNTLWESETTVLHKLLYSKKTWPETFQQAVWTLQSSAEGTQSWVLQVVVAKIQLPQTGGLRAENWWDPLAAFVCEVGLIQSDKKTETCLYKNTAKTLAVSILSNCYPTTFVWPEDLQFTVWMCKSIKEQFASRVLQVIVAQVQVPQIGQLGAEDWWELLTGFVCQPCLNQPDETTVTFIFPVLTELLIFNIDKSPLSLHMSLR